MNDAKSRKDNKTFDAVKTAFIRKHNDDTHRFEKDLNKLIELRVKQTFERARLVALKTNDLSPLQSAHMTALFTENRTLAQPPKFVCQSLSTCNGDVEPEFHCNSCGKMHHDHELKTTTPT